MFRMRSFILPLAALALAGCEANNLFVSHHTVIGLDAAVNTERTAGHLYFGYDRNTLTIVPVSVEDEADVSGDGAAQGGKEAMSALSCSEVEVTGIFLTGFNSSLATGEAAATLAENLEDKSDVFPCFQGE